MVRSNPSSERILLVEGIDDKHVVWHICANAAASFTVARNGEDMTVTLKGQENTFSIQEKGNRSSLISAIRQEVVASDRQAIGVVVDADANPGDCWSELVNGFSRTTIPIPSAPDPTGTIVWEQPGQPRVGIWMMPDNQLSGEIEDFLRQMISPTAPVWTDAQRYIENIPLGTRRFAPEKTDKAKLYAWLSTHREPARMGAAISDGDIQTDTLLCQTFTNWLIKLFG